MEGGENLTEFRANVCELIEAHVFIVESSTVFRYSTGQYRWRISVYILQFNVLPATV